MPRKPETNVEFVTRMMEFSNYGALAQLFILDALDKWSKKVAAADPADIGSPLISGHAWVGVAKEIQAKFATRMRENNGR
jgi:hypothetical protein